MKRFISALLSVLLVLLMLSSCKKNGKNPDGEVVFNGAVIAVESGTASVNAADEYKKSGATVSEYSAFSDALLALEGKKANFAVTDEFTSAKAIKANSDIECVGKSSFTMDFCAVFFNNDELLKAFNTAIESLTESGEIEKIKSAYLKGESYADDYTKTAGNGTLTMLTDASYEPFEYCGNDSEPTGIDIEIAKLICAYLGYSLSVKQADFDEMFSCLYDGKADFIMSAVTYTEERAGLYSFSEPYISLYYDIIALK